MLVDYGIVFNCCTHDILPVIDRTKLLISNLSVTVILTDNRLARSVVLLIIFKTGFSCLLSSYYLELLSNIACYLHEM